MKKLSENDEKLLSDFINSMISDTYLSLERNMEKFKLNNADIDMELILLMLHPAIIYKLQVPLVDILQSKKNISHEAILQAIKHQLGIINLSVMEYWERKLQDKDKNG